MFKFRSKISRVALFFSAVVLIIIFYGLSLRPAGRLPWHQQVVVAAVSPFQKSLTFIGRNISGVWRHYFSLVGESKENDILKKQVSEQSFKLERMTEIELENARLRDLISFTERNSLDGEGASVIGNDPRSDFRVISIDKGEASGVGVNMPVISSSGLVGKVAEVANGVSRVLLISDPNSAVDVMVQRSRARAILTGTMVTTELGPTYYLSRLEYMDRKSDIAEGDTVVTSGLDGIFPPGIPVGTLEKITHTKHGVFKGASVIPFTDFESLEEVFIVKKGG